jgi:hypothetical protein
MMKRPMTMLTMLMLITMSACGGNSGIGGNSDAGDDASVRGEGQDCVSDGDCPSAVGTYFVCAYAIADGCSAKGHCALLAVPTCAHEINRCGCDGMPVRASDCYYATGYAGGPVAPGPVGNGSGICGDGGA